jgi:hypothetical protein
MAVRVAELVDGFHQPTEPTLQQERRHLQAKVTQEDLRLELV